MRLTERLESWVLRRVVGPSGAMAAAYANMRKENYATAAEAFEDAEVLYRERGATALDIAKPLEFRAWCYARVGRLAEALVLYEQAMSLEQQAHSSAERLAKLRLEIEWVQQEQRAADE